MLKALLGLFHGPRSRAGELQTDTCARQFQVFLGETRDGVQSEGCDRDRFLQDMLKLAKECAKVSVGVDMLRRHRRSFNAKSRDFSA